MKISKIAPRTYICPRATSAPSLNGKLDDPAWVAAPWTQDFVDIQGETHPHPRLRTRAKMLWDDKCLYIGAELEEPHVSGTLTEHDSVIFHDNDFEVFMDPDDDGVRYAEFEINAQNTTWDLLLPKPYRAGGSAINGFELTGIRSAVHVDGSINDPSDVDRGWTVEIAIPWGALKDICDGNCPPKDGDLWRIGFSRVEWEFDVVNGTYVKRRKPEDNWVWSPQGVVDMHRPQFWGVLQFSSSGADVPAKELPGIPERELLHAIFDAQLDYRSKHGRFFDDLNQLGLATEGAAVFVTPSLFEATYHGWGITSDGQIKRP